MKKIIVLLICCSMQFIQAQSYKKIHEKAIFVDTHNDFLTKTMMYGFTFDSNLKGKTHSDLARLKQGGLDVQFFSVWSDGNQKEPYAFANRQIDSLDAMIKRNPKLIVKVATTKQLLKSVKQQKLVALIGIEGGHMIENNLDNLDAFYNRGVRYMTLTWNNSTDWASSAFDETFTKDLKHKGLTSLGKQIIQRMNQLGIMVDVSHVGEQTFWDVIATTTKPIIASHSSVYNLCQHQRNLKDDQIKAIAKNGGVIQINFNSGFLNPEYKQKETAFLEKHTTEIDSLKQSGKDEYWVEEYIYKKYSSEAEVLRARFESVIENITYVINLVGVDYVGIGSDFDGIVSTPLLLDDVTSYPLITKALLDKGYSEKDIDKILGGNLLRVLQANETK